MSRSSMASGRPFRVPKRAGFVDVRYRLRSVRETKFAYISITHRIVSVLYGYTLVLLRITSVLVSNSEHLGNDINMLSGCWRIGSSRVVGTLIWVGTICRVLVDELRRRRVPSYF